MAAAEPPASPVPTTRTLNFRRFAGLTSFMSKRCLSQDVSMGPAGALDRSSITASYLITPASTAMGKEMLPPATTTARPIAARLRQWLYRGWLMPSVCSMLQTPW